MSLSVSDRVSLSVVLTVTKSINSVKISLETTSSKATDVDSLKQSINTNISQLNALLTNLQSIQQLIIQDNANSTEIQQKLSKLTDNEFTKLLDDIKTDSNGQNESTPDANNLHPSKTASNQATILETKNVDKNDVSAQTAAVSADSAVTTQV